MNFSSMVPQGLQGFFLMIRDVEIDFVLDDFLVLLAQAICCKLQSSSFALVLDS